MLHSFAWFILLQLIGSPIVASKTDRSFSEKLITARMRVTVRFDRFV